MSATKPTLNQPRLFTNDQTPDFTGTGAIGDTITITSGGSTLGSVTVPGTGSGTANWTVTSSTLSAGVYTITATATKGSSSIAADNTRSFTVDLTKPVFSSTAVSSNNAIVTVTFSEAVFSTNAGSGALETTDLVFSITGGTATLASTAPTSIQANSTGTVYDLGLSLTGTANGSEVLTVQPAAADAIFDAAGNQADKPQTSNHTVTLNSAGGGSGGVGGGGGAQNQLPQDASCFPGNTPIQTDQGIVNICDLCPNKHTIRGNKIETVTQNTGIEDFLILIKKDTLYPNIPSQDTYITFDHIIFVNKQNVRAGVLEIRAQESGIPDLMNRICQVPYNGEILYNVLLKDEKHDYMCVNNLIVETMNPKNVFAKYYSYLKNKKQGEKNSELEESFKKYSAMTHALVKKHNRSRISKM